MAQLLKGKDVAGALSEKIKLQVEALQERGVRPCLAVVRVGENPGDLSYERGALKRADKVGVQIRKCVYEDTISEQELVGEIQKLNEDSTVHGVLIFRPLPQQIDDESVSRALLPQKDVDGITEGSLAGIFTGTHCGFAPCTARACMEILDYYGIGPEGKKVTVLGRSLVIGRPAAMMAMEKNATVTICHSRTGEDKMIEICRDSDVVIAAVGKAGMIDGRYVKDGQVILDVGINVNEAGNLCGDVNFDSASEAAGAITPVPGGVGSVTTAVLMLQTVEAAKASLID